MQCNIAGNNFSMMSGFHLSSNQGVNQVEMSYCPSNYNLFLVNMVYAIQRGLEQRMFDERGTILMIMPVTYGGVKHLENAGFKAVGRFRNSNSGNDCFHFVESVKTILENCRDGLKKALEKKDLEKSLLSVNHGVQIFKEIPVKIGICETILNGEDENK